MTSEAAHPSPLSPLVTVTIPTYNRAHMVGAAIRSVLEQSVARVEVFVSDNASTDDTASVVASFDDPRLRYVRNDRNLGPHANLSRGLELGTAPYLCILGDDDRLLPGSLERRLEVLEDRSDVGFVHCGFRQSVVGPDGSVTDERDIDWGGGPADTIEPATTVLRRLLASRYWISYHNLMLRRSLVTGLRVDPTDGLADDLGFALRLTARADSAAYLAEPLVVSTIHPGAHSVKEGVQVFGDGARYRASIAAIGNARRVRQRVLAELDEQGLDVRALRRDSIRHDRRGLQSALRWALWDPTIPSWRSVLEAGRIDPIAVIHPRGLRVLAAGALGSERYTRWQSLRGRPRSPGPAGAE